MKRGEIKDGLESVKLADGETHLDVWRLLGVRWHVVINWESIPASKHQGSIETGWVMILQPQGWIPCRVWIENQGGMDRRWVLICWCDVYRATDGQHAVREWWRDRSSLDLDVAKQLPDNPFAEEGRQQAVERLSRIAALDALERPSDLQ